MLINFVWILTALLSLVSLLSAKDDLTDVPMDDDGYRYIDTHRAYDKITLDGQLNEEDWQVINFQSSFFQREPIFGLIASEKTEVAVLEDSSYLYIGIKCYDTDAYGIIANEMRRDARLTNDDYFEIVIDTYHDHRNGYHFTINPNGARTDATFADEGRSFNSNWDGIWDCATRITDEGWFAEIAIPWKTLRFEEGAKKGWGVNFGRMIRRKNEYTLWQLISRDAGRMGFFRLSQAGDMNGLKTKKAGGNIEAEPYFLGGLAKDFENGSDYTVVKDIGLETSFALTSNLNLKLSWNTDFAQVEADQEQVNLTRFSLYFPEKREFFLDGAEIFNFGGVSMSGRGSSTSTPRLFYSRRIGIADGNQQPILGGAKLTGKSGAYQIGFINMQTEDFSAFSEDEDRVVDYPAVNYSVVRLKRELFKRSSIGIMFLNKQENAANVYNRSLGIDGIFPITDKFSISSTLSGTIDPETKSLNPNNKNLSGNLSVRYDSDLWDFQFYYMSIQENFNAEMGFIPRTNIRYTSGQTEYTPRPSKLKSIRQLRYQFSYSYLTDQQNTMLYTRISPSFTLYFQNSSWISLGLQREADVIDEDWEVREGLIIPKDTYWEWDSYLWVSTNESKDISFRLRSNYGNYYSGDRVSLSPRIEFKNLKNFRADLNFGYTHVSLPVGEFDIRTIGWRLYYYFSTNLYLKAYLQWKDDREATDGDRIAVSNILLRWTYSPGSDIYLVYNEGRRIGPTGHRISNRTLLLKTTFFWRK
jgi:hypothetical protein